MPGHLHDRKMESKTDRQHGTTTTVMWVLYQKTVGQRELSQTGKALSSLFNMLSRNTIL